MLELKAYAKVNLTLEVLRRRPDGYHEVASVMQTVSLGDTLGLEPAQAPALSLSCSDSALQGEDNLALRAARILQETKGSEKGAKLRLEKAIPVAAGLGGGSSDAAAALRGLNRLWGLGLSPEELLALAPRLGADVAFFLRGGTALARGQGEEITPLRPLPQAWLVIFLPPVPIPPGKTGRLYAALEPGDFSRGEHTQRLLAHLAAGGPLESALLYNAFWRAALAQFPGIERHGRELEGLAGAPAHLSGSGPSLFTLVSGQAQGQRLLESLRGRGYQAWLAHTLTLEGA
ncbi:MAG: 4-(cytidine 5'-diphospho)-2-C-methyl-D-erythritol kinase [Chloroflexi bacterium]|nr:4-(cytidine 5'-diphospho)-2-C-methyl-D-erythritol kinase [Chloroflexota bacterium]